MGASFLHHCQCLELLSYLYTEPKSSFFMLISFMSEHKHMGKSWNHLTSTDLLKLTLAHLLLSLSLDA